MSTHDLPLSRLDELRADRVLEGLAPGEAAELTRLGAIEHDAFDPLEVAAAEAALVWTSAAALPASLRAKLEALAAEFIAQRNPAPLSLAGARRSDSSPARVAPPTSRRMPAWGWAGLAAALAFGVFGWLTKLPRPDPAPEVARAVLLESAKDAVRWSWAGWSDTPDPCAKGVQGDVVWSTSDQCGYMRFAGLAPNDPRTTAYQLWIIDSTRPGEPPVDGGVFHVSKPGEIVVPIRPKLRVGAAAAFAITIEKPEGAVVSKQERRVVIAAAK